jgi:integrase
LTANRQIAANGTLTDPKTKRSLWTIPFEDMTLQCLLAWQSVQDRKRDRAGERWSDGPGLVLSTRYGTGLNKNNLARMVTAACEEAGIGHIVPHELRRSAITYRLDTGHEAWQVTEWAGTSEQMIADTYRLRLVKVSTIGTVAMDLDPLRSKVDQQAGQGPSSG